MTRVVVDDDRIIAALHAISNRSEICDPTGQVLGYFVPKSAAPVIYKGFRSPLTPEERERLIRDEGPTARPLSEFLDELKKKYPDEFQ
ncbi:MAG TPA: hypothetical protein VGI40_20695 [Pirellulaceae bacterium]|jgi:hypothetical protein